MTSRGPCEAQRYQTKLNQSNLQDRQKEQESLRNRDDRMGFPAEVECPSNLPGLMDFDLSRGFLPSEDPLVRLPDPFDRMRSFDRAFPHKTSGVCRALYPKAEPAASFESDRSWDWRCTLHSVSQETQRRNFDAFDLKETETDEFLKKEGTECPCKKNSMP